MPLSGAAMISDNTAAASFSRSAGSLSAASSGVSANVVAIVVASINFTVVPSLSQCATFVVRRPLTRERVSGSEGASPIRERAASWPARSHRRIRDVTARSPARICSV